MNSRIFYAKIFKDEFFAELTLAEKMLFIYFLFNLHVNIIHLYEVTKREVMFDTGVTSEELENAKNKFQANKKIFFYKNFVYLVNANRYQRFTGPDNETAKQRLLEQLPADVLEWYLSIADTPVRPLSDPLYLKLKLKSYKGDSNKDKPTEEDIDYDEVEKFIEKEKTARKN